MNKVQDIVTSTGLVDSDNALHGQVHGVLKDRDGNVVHMFDTPNNIVLGIRIPIIKLLGGWGADVEDLPFVRQIALGLSDTPATSTDEALGQELSGSRKLTATVPTISEDGLRLTFSFLYDTVDDAVDNQDIKELGLYTTDGTMIARTTVGFWRKTPGMYFEIYWTIGYNAQ